MAMIAIAAKEKRAIQTIDIAGAFLHVDMNDEVEMVLEAGVVAVLEKLDGSIAGFKREDGTVLVQLKKALYGCKQSSKLWYNHLKMALEEAGFVMNEADPCVFNIVRNEVQVSVGFHVDDLLCTCVDEKCLEWLSETLRQKFKEITVEKGNKLCYLGMSIDVGDEISISMSHYVEDLIRSSTGVAATAARNDLFELGASEKLNEVEKKLFHTTVAKLLYLSQRTRPDISLAVSFLCTRVSVPTKNDQNKLNRVLQYLSNTKEKVSQNNLTVT
jgi:Fe-S cluster biogenesis protein NfuA